MSEAQYPANDANSDEPGPRRSTYSPPSEEKDVPLTLGEDTTVDTPVVTSAPAQASPTPPSGGVPQSPVPPSPAIPGLPANVPPPPRRTSLSDVQIMEQMGHGGNTDQLINALQDQMALRAKEDNDFDTWATLVRQSFDEETAELAIRQGKRQFDGLPPEPVAATEPPAAPPVPPAAITPVEPAPAQQAPLPPSPVPPAAVSPSPVEPVAYEPVPSEEIILPRFGATPAVSQSEQDASVEPFSVPDSTASVEDRGEPTGEFEKLLVDPDAVTPPTDAWPLVAPEESTEEPAPSAQSEVSDDELQPTRVWETESAVVEETLVATTGSGEVEAVVSVQEFLSTKESREVPFENLSVEVVPGSRFGFDHVGEKPTPGNQRVDRALQLFWAWWAVGSPLVGVILGAWLIDSGLNLTQAILASVAGVLLASIPVIVGTLIGLRTGLPTLVSARAAYGLAGNVVPSIVMALVRIAVAAASLWAASWMVTGILVESNYWNGQEAIITVVVAAIVVLIAVGLAVAGRGYVQVTLWVSATLATLGLVALVLVTLPPVSSAAFSLPLGGPVALTAGIATVMSAFLVVWAHFGADLSRFNDSWAVKSATSLAPIGAVIPPLLLLSWGGLLGASDSTFREGLLTNFFDTVLEIAPVWYPIPAVILMALPLVGLAAMSLHSSGYAVMSIGIKMPRYAAVSTASALAALAALATIVFWPTAHNHLIDLALLAGVLVAGWVGGYTGEVVTRRVYLEPRMLTGESGNFPRWRVAPVIGFLVAIGAGLGLIELEGALLSWTGYLVDLAAVYTTVDLAGYQMGPLVALATALAFSLLAGIRGGVTTERAPQGA